MKKSRIFWAIAIAAFMILTLAGSLFAQASRRSDDGVTTTTTIERETADPTTSRSEPDIPVSGIVAPARTASDGPGGPLPDSPGEIMEPASRDIYIYVTLLAPPGPPPPDSVIIISKDCTVHDEDIQFKASKLPEFYGGDFYNVYRDTIALLNISQLENDTTAAVYNILPQRAQRYYTDAFTDTLWTHYWSSSKGVCDTLVNLFYVYTTVDTGAAAPGGYSESPYPSWCLCEYDQPLYTDPVLGTQNWISIPNIDDRRMMGSDLDSLGVTQVSEWDPTAQVLSTVAAYNPLFGWAVDGPLMINHVYAVFGTDGETPDIYQSYKPGIVATNDTSNNICYNPILGGRNIVMLPFHQSFIDDIHDRATLEASIEDIGGTYSAKLTRIDIWDGLSFSWNPIALENPLFGWTANPHLRPGMPYRIWMSNDAATAFNYDWPPTS